MEVRYSLELEDFVRLNQHLQDKEEQRKGYPFLIYLVACGVGGLGLAAFAAYKISQGDSQSAFGSGFTAIVGEYFFFSLLWNRAKSVKALRQRLSIETEDKVGKDDKIQLTSAGIVDTDQGGTKTIPWSSVTEIASARECVFCFADGLIWIVPHRSFSGKDEVDEFVREAQRFRDSATVQVGK